jgi:Uma2 family endonuclease
MPWDTGWHRIAAGLLISSADCELLRRHAKGYCSGNLFVYYRGARGERRQFRGPDFFFVEGAERKLRGYWVVDQEDGRWPNMVIELSSPWTMQIDFEDKKEIYENVFKVPEVFWYEPESRLLSGCRLTESGHCSIPMTQTGRLWSEQLSLWLGLHELDGEVYPRFFRSDDSLVTGFDGT